MSAERPSELSQKVVANPEVVTKPKETILGEWQNLPVVEQREIALDLLEGVMRSEHKNEFREAMDNRWPIMPKSFHSTFALVRLDREDLKRAHLDK